MADHSGIEWTDATWNPTRGCTKVSPGCAHCYIERTPPFRIAGNKFVHGKTDLEVFHDRLEQPLHWRRPRRVFVNSLSDLFHEDISETFIDRVFAVMALTPQHTYQVLTKRPERMRAYFTELDKECDESRAWWGCGRATETIDEWIPNKAWTNTQRDQIEENPLPIWPLPNVWLGVSVENQHFADERIPLLLETPAAVRFISAEPLLGPIDVEGLFRDELHPGNIWRECMCDEIDPSDRPCVVCVARSGLDWVIVGGESGPGARPFDLAWARSIVQQCRTAGVPVFVKQLGANAICRNDENDERWPGCTVPIADDYEPREQGEDAPLVFLDKKGGDPAEWPADLRVRQYPVSA